MPVATIILSSIKIQIALILPEQTLIGERERANPCEQLEHDIFIYNVRPTVVRLRDLNTRNIPKMAKISSK